MIKAVYTQIEASPSDTSSEMQKARLKDACQSFEAVLTSYLFKNMEESVLRAEEPEWGRQVFEQMMHDSLAQEVSRNEGLGLGEMLYEELLPLVEGHGK